MTLLRELTDEHAVRQISANIVLEYGEVAHIIDTPSQRGIAMLMNDLFDKYLEEYVPALEPRTQRDYRGRQSRRRRRGGALSPRFVGGR